ncbi:MAG: hypothetical protein KGK07_16105 [Chloroflexota bacterium]|nr:hypothetical protein [Chloroflexota bacterium]
MAGASPPNETDPTPAASTPDTSDDDDGYEIHLCVYADGTFGVRGPMPLDQEQDQSQPGRPGGSSPTGAEPKGVREQTFDAAGPAVKAVLKILQANPVNASEQEGFEAGFGAAPEAGFGAAPEAGVGAAPRGALGPRY